MRVLIVSTSEQTGGGAIAARRLTLALNRHGAEATMMVRDRQTGSPLVVSVGNKLPKAAERLGVLLRNGFSRRHLWAVDTAARGIDITRSEAFRRADVVHLHWVNQGMLSLPTLRRILRSGKRVVWTLHDEWPYVGVCHYRGECRERDCARCPLLRGTLPRRLLEAKREMYQGSGVRFVGCSRWITRRAAEALPGVSVTHINNCIPTDTFRPMPQHEARARLGLPPEGKIVLFCAQRVTDERKGMGYLLRALRSLERSLRPLPRLVVAGKGMGDIPYPLCARLGTVHPDLMPALYAAADVFVTPSLEDNLPNTIAEAMTMGTPCVGFETGGIPEMIDHLRNGYVARCRDADDLAAGIAHTLRHATRDEARRKALAAYDEARVARRHIELYEST